MRGVRMDLCPVDRDHPDLHEARLPAQPKHRAEQLGQRVLMAGTEARDRRVIGLLLGSDHPVGDILHALALDPPRRAFTPRIGIEQKRHHHRRLKRRPPPPIPSVGSEERGQIHLFDRRQHKPRQVVLRQPIPRVRGHQERLLTIARQEVHSHTLKCLNLLGRSGDLRDSLDEKQARPRKLRPRPLSRGCIVHTRGTETRGLKPCLPWKRAVSSKRTLGVYSSCRLCKAINATKCGCGYKDGTATASSSISWSRSPGRPVGGLPRCSATPHDDRERRWRDARFSSDPKASAKFAAAPPSVQKRNSEPINHKWFAGGCCSGRNGYSTTGGVGPAPSSGAAQRSPP